MTDLVATTETILRTMPAAGHGMAAAARGLMAAQQADDSTWHSVLLNWRLYVATGGAWTINWCLSWWAKNVTPPTVESPILKKFAYAVLVKLADITASIPIPGFKNIGSDASGRPKP